MRGAIAEQKKKQNIIMRLQYMCAAGKRGRTDQTLWSETIKTKKISWDREIARVRRQYETKDQLD